MFLSRLARLSLSASLTVSSGIDNKNVYNLVFNSKTPYDDLLIDKWGESTSDDVNFLKDSQKLYKNINDLENEQYKVDKMINIWNKLNNETNFLEKYQTNDTLISVVLSITAFFFILSNFIVSYLWQKYNYKVCLYTVLFLEFIIFIMIFFSKYY